MCVTGVINKIYEMDNMEPANNTVGRRGNTRRRLRKFGRHFVDVDGEPDADPHLVLDVFLSRTKSTI